jgi:hypothetical protein
MRQIKPFVYVNELGQWPRPRQKTRQKRGFPQVFQGNCPQAAGTVSVLAETRPVIAGHSPSKNGYART